MRHNFNLMLYVWMAFTALLVATLAINAVRALFGHATFAYWHLITLAMCWLMTRAQWAESPAEQKAPILRFILVSRQKAAKAFSNISRAVRSLPALFTPNHNRFQTEP